jgi:hypothetical protein
MIGKTIKETFKNDFDAIYMALSNSLDEEPTLFLKDYRPMYALHGQEAMECTRMLREITLDEYQETKDLFKTNSSSVKGEAKDGSQDSEEESSEETSSESSEEVTATTDVSETTTLLKPLEKAPSPTPGTPNVKVANASTKGEKSGPKTSVPSATKEKSKEGLIEKCTGYKKYFSEEASKRVRATGFTKAAEAIVRKVKASNNGWRRFSVKEVATGIVKYYKQKGDQGKLTEIENLRFDHLPLNVLQEWFVRSFKFKRAWFLEDPSNILDYIDSRHKDFETWLMAKTISEKALVPILHSPKTRPTYMSILLAEDIKDTRGGGAWTPPKCFENPAEHDYEQKTSRLDMDMKWELKFEGPNKKVRMNVSINRRRAAWTS